MGLRHSLFAVTVAVVFAATLFGSFSCRKDEPTDACISYQFSGVSEVTGLVTTRPGQPVDLEVSFQVYNGCGSFGMFRESSDGNERTIEVRAKYQECQACTQNAPTLRTYYRFVSSTPGTHLLKFRKGGGEFVYHAITVQ